MSKKGSIGKMFLKIIAVILSIVVLLYLILIMPRVMNKPDMSGLEGWLYAHRGFHDNTTDAPENSLRSFEKAIEMGYGIELDVHLSKDQIPVVFHDDTLERVCGVEGKVGDYTYEELQQFKLFDTTEKIPSLAEVLELIDGKVPVIVEYKGDNFDTTVCEMTDPVLREYQGAYCIQSFNPLLVGWYRQNRKEVVRGQLSEKLYTEGEDKSILNFVLENLLLNVYAKPDYIAYKHDHYDNLSRILATKLFGNTSAAYTIKNQEEYETAKKRFQWIIFDSFIPE